MIKAHRNSQKRIYSENHPVFITTNTYKKFPYFDEDVFCQLLVEEINYAQTKMDFELIAYKINPDHIHMIIIDNKNTNYSKIMQFIKRHTSRNVNILINSLDMASNIEANVIPDKEATLANVASEMDPIIEILKNKLLKKYSTKNPFPTFRWQKSFNNWIIRSEKELSEKIEYIVQQSDHHGLEENKYLYIANQYSKSSVL